MRGGCVGEGCWDVNGAKASGIDGTVPPFPSLCSLYRIRTASTCKALILVGDDSYIDLLGFSLNPAMGMLRYCSGVGLWGIVGEFGCAAGMLGCRPSAW